MAVHTFNYTNRSDTLRVSGDDPELIIKSWATDNGMKFEPFIKIDEKRKFPSNAIIKIQAYSTRGDNYVSEPYSFGTISEPDLKTVELETGLEGTNFSFRIVDTDKNVLCLIEPIRPKKGSTLLEYAEDDQQDVLYKLSIVPDQIPIVFFKKGYGLKTLLNESGFLKGFVFTPAIKDVLTKYLLMPEEFEDCEIRKDWIKNFTKLTNEDPPKKEDFWKGDEKETNGEQWINKAIVRFTNKPNPKKVKLIDLIPNKDVSIKEKLGWKK